ncbi:hypothetical protein ACH5RR_007027, partial [Cinchona calisaya]
KGIRLWYFGISRMGCSLGPNRFPSTSDNVRMSLSNFIPTHMPQRPVPLSDGT